MDGCEALFDSVYDDVRDSLVSYIMIAFGKSTGKYAETKALDAPPACPLRVPPRMVGAIGGCALGAASAAASRNRTTS